MISVKKKNYKVINTNKINKNKLTFYLPQQCLQSKYPQYSSAELCVIPITKTAHHYIQSDKCQSTIIFNVSARIALSHNLFTYFWKLSFRYACKKDETTLTLLTASYNRRSSGYGCKLDVFCLELVAPPGFASIGNPLVTALSDQ